VGLETLPPPPLPELPDDVRELLFPEELEEGLYVREEPLPELSPEKMVLTLLLRPLLLL